MNCSSLRSTSSVSRHVRKSRTAAFLSPLMLLRLTAVMLVVCLGPLQTAEGQSARSWQTTRDAMVRDVLQPGGIRDPRVLESMRTTPRHEFVQSHQRHLAYVDMALPIGESQTISGIFVVAYMTEQLQPEPTDTVLEIGLAEVFEDTAWLPLDRLPQRMPAVLYQIPLSEIQRGTMRENQVRGYADRLEIKPATQALGSEVSFSFTDSSAPRLGDYYYFKVELVNGGYAYSSPAFVESD